MKINRTPEPNPKSFQIGHYDEGLFDLADKVTVDKKQTFKTRDEALKFAQANPGAEMVVEQRNAKGQLGYDVYSVTIHDKGQSLKTGKHMENLSLFAKPLQHIETQTGQRTQRAFFVPEDNQPTKPLYNQAFDQTLYDKMRDKLGLDDSKRWFGLVDKYMSAPSPPDQIPNIERAEINDMKATLQPGDLVMTGNNGSFIHAIVYVGEDPQLQAQLEQKWGLQAGSLKGEGLILHSLAVDKDVEVEVDGQKIKRPAGGTGVVIDTIEAYLDRHPRDTMIAVEVKGATAADRKAVIEEGKAMVGRNYDNGFNTFDDRDIYCTEFVYKAWMAAPDTDTQFDTQLHPLVPQTSGPISGFLYDKLPENMQLLIKDNGYLYQEMIMTDGIITSPAVEIKWANQHADKSEFIQKHERWADGMAGKISKSYQNLLQEHVPAQATRSHQILERVQELSAQSRSRLNPEK